MNEGTQRALLSLGQLRRYVIGLCASVGFLGGCALHNEVNASKYPPTMVRLGPASFWMSTDESEIPKLMLRYPDLPADVFLPEAPRHFVRLNSYSLDRYEVTKAQFRDFLVADRSWRSPPEFRGCSESRPHLPLAPSCC
jgi:formylglycine-generating enzyme required for sulfatase activity